MSESYCFNIDVIKAVSEFYFFNQSVSKDVASSLFLSEFWCFNIGIQTALLNGRGKHVSIKAVIGILNPYILPIRMDRFLSLTARTISIN